MTTPPPIDEPEMDPHEHDLPSADEARVGGFVPPPPEACAWALACHLAAFVGPWGPLVPWLIQRDLHPFVDDQGKEAINFQITSMIAAAILLIPGFFTCGIPYIALGIYLTVYVILGAIAAHKGENFRYPINWRLIK